jgi:hypothetical protein
VSVATSGHDHLVFGDTEGNIHLVSRQFQVTTFRAYELNVQIAEQLRNVAVLVTVGVSVQKALQLCCKENCTHTHTHTDIYIHGLSQK